MLQFKNNVTVCFSSSNQAILAGALKVMDQQGYDCIITGGLEGTHNPESAHYRNQALDFRTQHIPVDQRILVFEALKSQFPPATYTVLWEGQGTPNEHFHIQIRRP